MLVDQWPYYTSLRKGWVLGKKFQVNQPIKNEADIIRKQLILVDDPASPHDSLDQNSKPLEGPWMYFSGGEYKEDTKDAIKVLDYQDWAGWAMEN